MIFSIVFFALVLLYLIFFVGPAAAAFLSVFSRKEGADPEQIDPNGSYYAPYLPEMRHRAELLRARGSREVFLTARDGVRLAADFYDSGAKTLAICMHGYRATPMTSFCYLGRELSDLGCDLLFVHERAHGKSQGSRSSLGLLESGDLLQWVQWAQEYTDAQRLILCGVSMGATATAIASNKIRSDAVCAMILDCGFDTPYKQMVSDCRKWHLPGRVLVPIISVLARLTLHVNLKTSACDSLSQTKIPAFFLHGTDDRSVSPQDAEKCYAACASEKELVLVPGAQHTVALMRGGEETCLRVRAFLKKHGAV